MNPTTWLRSPKVEGLHIPAARDFFSCVAPSQFKKKLISTHKVRVCARKGLGDFYLVMADGQGYLGWHLID